MKVHKFETVEEWMDSRRCKITGTRVKDLVVKRGTGRKIGFYELVAERIANADDGENPMERGQRLEEEALERFSEETGKKVKTDLVIWTRDDNENIALSPDGWVKVSEAVEVKCLSSARHLQAFFEGVPKDYKDQTIQYFVVNDKLKVLHVVFYDPRLTVKDYFCITIKREEYQEEIEKYLEYQKQVLQEVDDIVNELTF